MATQTISSSEFNRDSGSAKRASESGPVVITDRGAPSHVLMTWKEYRQLAGKQQTIAEALAMPGVEDVSFDPPRLVDRPTGATLD